MEAIYEFIPNPDPADPDRYAVLVTAGGASNVQSFPTEQARDQYVAFHQQMIKLSAERRARQAGNGL